VSAWRDHDHACIVAPSQLNAAAELRRVRRLLFAVLDWCCMRLTATLCLALFIMLHASCRSGATDPLSPCVGPIAPALEQGTSARFTWTPACGLQRIAVIQAPSAGGTCASNNFGIAWDLKASSALLAPGIDYGASPTGSMTIMGPCPIESGKDYRVDFLAPGQVQAVGVLAWRP
jgi:hypothetical protein